MTEALPGERLSPLEQALRVLRQAMSTEKETGDSLMRQKWSDERDTLANQHYYAADVLQDAIAEIEVLKP